MFSPTRAPGAQGNPTTLEQMIFPLLFHQGKQTHQHYNN